METEKTEGEEKKSEEGECYEDFCVELNIGN